MRLKRSWFKTVAQLHRRMCSFSCSPQECAMHSLSGNVDQPLSLRMSLQRLPSSGRSQLMNQQALINTCISDQTWWSSGWIRDRAGRFQCVSRLRQAGSVQPVRDSRPKNTAATQILPSFENSARNSQMC